MLETVDCLVIGAGVVGLACARALARSGREVVVLEAAETIGTQTSSRNSEVLHAGIYYPRGSLKARLCVEGQALLYRYCQARSLPYQRIGKMIVATDASQHQVLTAYQDNAVDNGVTDVEWVNATRLRALEPNVIGDCALLSPSTGIIDSHALMLSLQGDIESSQGLVVFNSPVLGGQVTDKGILLSVGTGVQIDPVDVGSVQTESVETESAETETMQIMSRTVINCAGLSATSVAKSIAGLAADFIPACYYAKGHYFTLQGKSPFQHLIYPVADTAGLGIHVTLDMQGQVRFGPDVQWQQDGDYAFNQDRKDFFIQAIQRYYPTLDPDRLQPGYTGIRAKVVPRGQAPHDFIIQSQSVHGVSGLVNLFGIESPGLTASLAIARYVTNLAKKEASTYM